LAWGICDINHVIRNLSFTLTLSLSLPPPPAWCMYVINHVTQKQTVRLLQNTADALRNFLPVILVKTRKQKIPVAPKEAVPMRIVSWFAETQSGAQTI